MIRDKHGREIRPGDVVRVFHYRDSYTGRHVYMHKLVVLVDDDLEVSHHGSHLYVVDICGIWKAGSLNCAHKCRLVQIGECEIIDGRSRQDEAGVEAWYDRPKKLASA